MANPISGSTVQLLANAPVAGTHDTSPQLAGGDDRHGAKRNCQLLTLCSRRLAWVAACAAMTVGGAELPTDTVMPAEAGTHDTSPHVCRTR
jgi:hypothetical protein